MSTLVDKVYSYYNNKHSVDVCERFFASPNDPELLNEAWESVLPILGIIVRNHFKSMQDDDLDDLIQMGAIEYWKVLSESDPKPRPFSISAHFNLYYKVGIRSMLKANETNKPRIIDFFGNNALPPVATSNFRSPDQEIFIQELPQIIYDSVETKLVEGGRFKDKELEICKYIARCKVFRNEIQRFQIRKIGGKVTNSDFFEQYVTMIVTEVIQDLKDTIDIGKLLNDEGMALNPVYYHCEDGPKDRYRE